MKHPDAMARPVARHWPLAQADPLDFSEPLLRLQDKPTHPLGRRVLWAMLGFLALLLLWATLGQLEIVAVAEGKLVPQSHVKIVQPAEAGIVQQILVKEGEPVRAGQVLMRMDALLAEADTRSLAADVARKRLSIRRIDAELGNQPFHIDADDPSDLVRATEAQYRANRAALATALAEERARLAKAQQEWAAALQVRQKLEMALVHYREQDIAFEQLARDGFAGSIMAGEKKRERMEKEQELKTQHHLIASARASMAQSQERLQQIEAESRQKLFAERNELMGQLEKLAQEVAKQAHRQALLELKAPQEGVVKDLATHTVGTVVQPGTVMLTLVPNNDVLKAEVWVANEDIGFVRAGQTVKLKIAPYPFQKYGLVHGRVDTISADASDPGSPSGGTLPAASPAQPPPLRYKAQIALTSMHPGTDGQHLTLSAGMQAQADIVLGTRSVLAYLLSPVTKAWHEAARER